MATGESVESDTLIAKAGGGNGRGRKQKLNNNKPRAPTTGGRGRGRESGGGVGGSGGGGVGVGVGASRGVGGSGGVGGNGGGAFGVGGSGGGGERGVTTPTVSTATKNKRAQFCTICKNHNEQVLKKRHKCPYKDCQCPLCQLSRRVQCVMCHQQRLWRFRKSQEKNGTSSSSPPPPPHPHPQGDGSRGEIPPPVPTANSSSSPSSSSSSPSGSPSSSFVGEGDYHQLEFAVDDPLSATELVEYRERLQAERSAKKQVCDKCRNHNIKVSKRGHKGKCPYENCKCKYCSFTIKRRDLMKHQQRVRRAQVTIKPTKSSEDYVLQPSENSPTQQDGNGHTTAAAAAAATTTEDSAAVTSPPGLSPAHNNSQEAQINITHVSPDENQVNWPSCSNDETSEDPRHSPKISHKPSGGSTVLCQQPSREFSSFQQPTRDSTPFQQQSKDSTPFQQQNRVSMPFQQISRESTPYQQQSEDSTPFQQPRRYPNSFQQQNMESMKFHQQRRDSMPFSQQSRDSLSFQQPSRESTPFQQPSIESTSFQQPNRDPTSFQHPSRNSTPFQHPPRDSTPFQQHCRDSNLFQHPAPMNHASSYVPMIAEIPLHSPLKRVKVEPNVENDITYEAKGNQGPSRDFENSYTPMRSYNSGPEIHHTPSSQHQLKFGVQQEDLLLRQWTTNDMEEEEEVCENDSLSQNEIDFRGSTMCNSSHHIEQEMAQQHPQLYQQHPQPSHSQHHPQPSQSQQHPQPSHSPMVTSTRPMTFEHPAVSLVGGWNSSPQVRLTTTTLARVIPSGQAAQLHHSTMRLPANEAFLPAPMAQGQSAWWHQVRLPSLERTNSV